MTQRQLQPVAGTSEATIPTFPAVITWLTAWLVVNAAAVPGVLALLGADLRNLTPTDSIVALTVQWAVFGGALVVASRLFGSGSFLRDFGARVRAVDLIGIPIGVALQAIVLPLAYWPLREAWPETFSPEALEERSRGLIDGAGGFALVTLSVFAVIGAPLIEELVYRGLLQRSIGRRIGAPAAWVLASLLFAAVHFSAVDFLGLLIAGLVFGAGVLVTGRIGFGFFAHVGFNAVAMVGLLATR